MKTITQLEKEQIAQLTFGKREVLENRMKEKQEWLTYTELKL